MERAHDERQEGVPQEPHGGDSFLGAGRSEEEASLAPGGGNFGAALPEDEGRTDVRDVPYMLVLPRR